MKTVLFLSPGYPAEMPKFVRGLAQAGARVIGLGDQPESSAAERGARSPRRLRARAGRSRTRTGSSPRRATIADARAASTASSRLWEPLMIAGRADPRGARRCPGMTVEETVPFRDKERMKQVLDAAGIRTPRHARARTSPRSRAAMPSDRLPGHRQADRRRRLGRHAPRATTPTRSSARSAQLGPRRRGQRRGVHRRRGVHLRHDLRRRRDPLREHLLVPAAAADRAHSSSGSARRRSRCATRSRPTSRPAASLGTPCIAAHGLPARASRTWSGTERPTARWSSARSARGRRARSRSTS